MKFSILSVFVTVSIGAAIVSSAPTGTPPYSFEELLAGSKRGFEEEVERLSPTDRSGPRRKLEWQEGTSNQQDLEEDLEEKAPRPPPPFDLSDLTQALPRIKTRHESFLPLGKPRQPLLWTPGGEPYKLGVSPGSERSESPGYMVESQHRPDAQSPRYTFESPYRFDAQPPRYMVESQHRPDAQSPRYTFESPYWFDTQSSKPGTPSST